MAKKPKGKGKPKRICVVCNADLTWQRIYGKHDAGEICKMCSVGDGWRFAKDGSWHRVYG